MKITKQGLTKDQRLWTGKCRACQSEAEAVESEMTHITYDQREGGSFSWERCPVCEVGGESGYGGMLFYPTATTGERR
jgi:type II secretory ATPase GspE/PulE/Tfp pilus assembly ATPase PilB-like protein